MIKTKKKRKKSNTTDPLPWWDSMMSTSVKSMLINLLKEKHRGLLVLKQNRDTKKIKSSVTPRVWDEEEEITLLESVISKRPKDEIDNLIFSDKKKEIKDKLRNLSENFQKYKDDKFINLHLNRITSSDGDL